LLGAKNVLNSEIHWVVKHGGNRSLISSNVRSVTVENLSHLENARGCSELSPEILGNLWDGVNSNSIEAELLNEVLDPVLELLSDPTILLVQIWEVSKSAVLNLPLVVPVLDVTLVVVMVRRVEWVD
jgi:hypothetical protein